MYRRILVAVDGSSTSTRGVQEAVKLAKLTDARVRLVHVIDELSFVSALAGSSMAISGVSIGDQRGLMHDAGTKILDDAINAVKAEGIRAEGSLVDTFAGSVDEVILAEARDWQAELIVVGTHGRRGLGRLLLGSSAEMIVRSSPVPVLLVRDDESRTASSETPGRVSIAGAIA